MEKPNAQWGLSDDELTATIESLPDGFALFDEDGDLLWANRRARRLLALFVSTGAGVADGTALALLVARLVVVLSPVRRDEHARWSVEEGSGVVDVALRYGCSAHVAVRLSSSCDVARGEVAAASALPADPLQLIILERMLDEDDLGLAVANGGGQIRWMNQQAKRLFSGATRWHWDVERDVGRAARHVAMGKLTAPVRTRLQLPTRMVDAQFWRAGNGLAGVRFGDEHELFGDQPPAIHSIMRAARPLRSQRMK
jgi:PAS domain-containing protein